MIVGIVGTVGMVNMDGQDGRGAGKHVCSLSEKCALSGTARKQTFGDTWQKVCLSLFARLVWVNALQTTAPGRGGWFRRQARDGRGWDGLDGWDGCLD